MALLVQREVADRVTAASGSRAYGYLSVLTQLHSEPHIALAIPPGAFSPHPKVHSAIVAFRMSPKFSTGPVAGRESPTSSGRATLVRQEDRERFLDFVKHCFAHKRKNLMNSLTGTYARQRVGHALAALSLAPTIRAEQLTLEHFAQLFLTLSSV
jgi:16S rRNA (adenine1518-N6/adenine1519-N6)-dimethyltransferase